MATKTWVGTTSSWNTAGNWSPSGVPANGDDVIMNNAANCSVDVATNNLRSFDMTGYTGTLSNSFTINVVGAAGSTTTCKFAGTITWTGVLALAPPSTATINLSGNVTYDLTLSSAGAITIFDNTTIRTITAAAYTGTLTHTSAKTLTVTGATFSFPAGMSYVCNQGLIVCNGNNLSFTTGSKTFYDVTLSGTGLCQQGGSPTFTNLTRSSANITDIYQLNSGTTTVNGILKLQGASAINRLMVQSNTISTSRPIVLGASATCRTAGTQYVDFSDIALSGGAVNERDLSAITGGSGDCGGNTGITFTASDTQTWNNSSGGNWSIATNWTGTLVSRIPLSQDDVNLGIAYTTSRTVTANMPRLGRNISWAGATYVTSLTFSMNTLITSVYGSLNLTGVSAFSNNQGLYLQSQTRSGINTLTTNGKTFSASVVVMAAGATVRLADNFVNAGGTYIQNGTLDAGTNNVNVTANTILDSGVSTTRGLIMGTGTWTVTRATTGSAWSLVTSGMTLNSTGSSIVISDTSSAVKTFAGGGLSYNNVTFPSGTGGSIITGANSFIRMTIAAGGSLTLPASTINNTTLFNATGASGSVITLLSSAPGTPATLNKTGGGLISCNYLNITDTNVTPANTWYRGDNSVLNSGTGWVAGNGNNKFLEFFS